MIVRPLMEFELYFSCVLLMTLFEIDEIANILGFAGHRLFDDVLIAIICIMKEVWNNPDLHILHLVSEWQGQNP